jgi:hypothetical protein
MDANKEFEFVCSGSLSAIALSIAAFFGIGGSPNKAKTGIGPRVSSKQLLSPAAKRSRHYREEARRVIGFRLGEGRRLKLLICHISVSSVSAAVRTRLKTGIGPRVSSKQLLSPAAKRSRHRREEALRVIGFRLGEGRRLKLLICQISVSSVSAALRTRLKPVSDQQYRRSNY